MRTQLRYNTVLGIATVVLVCATGSVHADFIFGTPANLGPLVNSPVQEGSPDISADGLTLFYDVDLPGGNGDNDIWAATRASPSEPWGEPVNLGAPVNSTASDWGPNISSDGLALYFASTDRPGGFGGADLWVVSRQTFSGPWGQPVNLGPTVNSAYTDGHPSITDDGLELYFSGNYDGTARPGGLGGSDIWVTTRATEDDAWGVPIHLGPMVNSTSFDGEPDISPDGLTLFFASDRPGGLGSWDVWMTTRTSRSDPWARPVNLGPPVNSSSTDPTPAISEDGSCLYFMSNRSGGFGDYDMWQVPVFPRVDFDGSGFVDIADLVVLIEHWGQDEPSVDMGPMPWGDRVVDAADLEVLMRHWGQEAYDPTLIARWKLDEAAGIVAADSAGTHDGTLAGDPL